LEVTETQEKEILGFASKKNMLLQGKALNALKACKNFKQVIESLEEDGQFILSKELVEEKSKLLDAPKCELEPKVIVEKSSFSPRAKELTSNLKILKELDVTGQSCCEGKAEDFKNLFKNKFKFLSGMLKRRHTLSPKPIKRLKGVVKNEKLDLIGMVYKKWTTKNGHLAFQLEDIEARCIVLVMKNDEELGRLAEHVMLDDVIGVKGIKWGDDLIIAKDLLWPELPMRPQKCSEEKVSIASISDMHMGSKLFLEKEFHRFLDWINGRIGSEKEREQAGNIKYLMVVGDNVDGIGIYPKQFDELNIRDINKQYDAFSKLIMEIPEYIEIVITPGQHDAVRWADPQPAVPKEFVKELSEMKNIHFVGSPSWLEVEELKVLLWHGGALHDLISNMSFLDSTHPQDATVELLKKRDLMPAYGLRYPYVPEKKDFMVIREEPDLVFIGDMHHHGIANYRGTTVVHNGTWQGRTNYQIKLGHTPTPGVVPVIDLHTRKISQKNFIGEEGE
jgi:DNA polymerase II small subunit